MKQPLTSLWIINVIKAVASQLIVLHHFISYGPLARTLKSHATELFDWLYHDGRMAVQAFLVVGGFLAARSLSPHPGSLAFEPSGRVVFRLAWHRYVRLVSPYVVALLLAIVFAACARFLMQDPDTPAAPSFKQILCHLFLIHDIVGLDALSAGVWYIAIDLQLFCLLLLMLWLSQRLAIAFRLKADSLALLLLISLSASSLFWFNRYDSMDMWAIYFVGAYALGVLVQWSCESNPKQPWLLLLLLIYALALAVEWRTRLVVSLVIGSLLWLGHRSNLHPMLGLGHRKVIDWLSRISYSVFLVHYPVVLLIGTIIALHWPENVTMAAMGYLMAWLATLGLAHLLYSRVETKVGFKPDFLPIHRSIG